MPRTQGVFDFSANYEVKIVGPLDARTVVATYAQLFDAQMQSSYPYAGMVVSVNGDTDQLNGLYLLKQMPCIASNWIKVGSNESYVSVQYEPGGFLKFQRGNGDLDSVNISDLATDFYITGGTMTPSTLKLDLQSGKQVEIDVTQVTNNNLKDVQLVGTNLIVTTHEGVSHVSDLNTLYLSGVQFKKGLTTHDFFTLSQVHFTGSTFPLAFPSAAVPPAENIKLRTLSFNEFPAKETTVVVKVESTDGVHFLLKLPSIAEADAPNRVGTRIRVFMKWNNISDKSKHFMLATEWNNGGANNRIVSVSANTKVDGLGYFFPMETMEVVDLFWDGEDWIALNTGKQEYSLLAAENYQTDISTYIKRG